MHHPLISPQMAQAIGGKIGRFADAHACQTRQQQSRGKQIVAAAKFGLESCIVLWRQRTGQNIIAMWDVLAHQQPRPWRKGMIGKQVTIDAAYVRRVLAETVKDEDLSRYVL